jgi:hypothetical protein
MPQLAQPLFSSALAQKIPNSGFLNNRRPHDRLPDRGTMIFEGHSIREGMAPRQGRAIAKQR